MGFSVFITSDKLDEVDAVIHAGAKLNYYTSLVAQAPVDRS